MRYCESPYFHQRRESREVVIGDPKHGGVIVGGDHPVVKQSMLTCDTMDTAACVKQTLELVEVGCQLVRITAPTVKDAANLKNIVAELRARGCLVPIVADIHFKPEAALEAVKWVEVVRINPGNYADKKKFAVKEYTDAEYAAELKRIEEAFAPLVTECIRLKRALRIGTNHGSLRDTIRVSLTEDSPLEIEVCNDLLAQIASLTVKTLNRGTVKSDARLDDSTIQRLNDSTFPFDPFHYERRSTPEIELTDGVKCGGEQTVRVVVPRATWEKVAPKIRPKDDVKPEEIYEDLHVMEVDPTNDFDVNCDTQLVTVKDGVSMPAITAFRLLAARLKRLGRNNPILLKDYLNFGIEATSPLTPSLSPSDGERVAKPGEGSVWPLEPRIALLRASVVIGSLLADGIGDAILIRGEPGAGQSLRLAYNILQAAGCRSFKTDYVACPSCGRTLFNLQTVTARIKERTQHLKGVKIAIMGCIVNGPGEMADADFGYVGGALGKINLYVGKSPIKFNIPEIEAVDLLVDLIREHGKWVEPASVAQPEPV